MKKRIKMFAKETLVIFFAGFGWVAAQSQPCPSLDGIIAGCILGTLAFCLLVIAVTLLIIYFCRKRKPQSAAPATGDKRKSGNLIPAEHSKSELAYDNPVFRDEADNATSNAEQGFAGYVQCKEYVRKNPPIKSEPVAKNNGIHGRQLAPHQTHSLDRNAHKDKFQGGECITVPLQSQDFIGLGFDITGNMRDGIFVSQVNNKGPATDSHLIHQGDKIQGVYVSFDRIVYEDALTILSYASPYPVKIDLQKKVPSKPGSATASPKRGSNASQISEQSTHGLSHPKYRSHSLDDLSRIDNDKEKLHLVKSFTQEESPPQTNLHKFKNYSNLHDEIELEENITLEQKQASVSNLSQLSYPEVGELNMDEYISPRKKSLGSHGSQEDLNPSISISMQDMDSGDFNGRSDSLCNYAASELDIPAVNVEADVHPQQVPDVECSPLTLEEPSGSVEVQSERPRIHSDLLSEMQADLPNVYKEEPQVQVEEQVFQVELPQVHSEPPGIEVELEDVHVEQPEVEVEQHIQVDLPEVEAGSPRNSFDLSYGNLSDSEPAEVQVELQDVHVEQPEVEVDVGDESPRESFDHSFSNLSDQDKLDVIRLSYEEPGITVETVAMDSNHSSSASSPDSGEREPERPDLDFDGGIDINLHQPETDAKLQEKVTTAFDVRSDEGRTNSHSSSHSDSPTNELVDDNTQQDAEPKTELNVFSGYSNTPVVIGASAFMTDAADEDNDNNVDFLSNGPVQADTGPQTVSDDTDEQIAPSVAQRVNTFNPDFSLYEKTDNESPRKKEAITIDMFPEDFSIPDMLMEDRENAASPVSSISEEEFIVEIKEKAPLEINFRSLESPTSSSPLPIVEPDLEMETSGKINAPPTTLFLSGSVDPSLDDNKVSPTSDDLDGNRNKKDGLDIKLAEQQFEDLRADISPSGEFHAKPAVVIGEDPSPPSTPSSEEEVVENHVGASSPDEPIAVKMRPHSPRSNVTNIRSSLSDARAKFFADMTSPEKEVKPFMPRNFEPLKLNGTSDAGSSVDTSPVSTPEKLNFPLDTVEMIHKQRRDSMELTPPHSPTRLMVSIDVDETDA